MGIFKEAHVLRKLVALSALVAAFVAVPATTAVAEPYTPQIPTRTLIEVTVQDPGEPVILHVSASANYPTPPEGDIAVQLTAPGTAARGAQAVVAAPIFTTTVHFVDDPVRIVGPRLPKGTYLASAEFTPDDVDLFLPSDDSTRFRVGAGGGDDGDDDGNDGLPNTGGPNMMWLILGGGLVAAGAGGVGISRRRQTAAV